MTSSDRPGKSLGLSLAGLGAYLQTLGMVSLLLVGLGMLLEASSAFVVVGVAYARGYDTGAGGALWGVLAGLLMLISIAVLSSASTVRKGLFPRTVTLLIFLSSISLFMEALGTLVSPTLGPSVAATTFTIAAGVILIAALAFSASESVWVLLTAAFLGLVSMMLLLVRIGDLGGDFSRVGGTSLNSYLLSAPLSSASAVASAANFFAALGIVGTTSLVYIAYLTVAIGLAMRAILRTTNFAPLSWVTAFVGFLLYGADLAWGNASALGAAQQGSVDWTFGALPFVSAIVLEIASYVIIAGAAIGLVIHGQDLRLALTQKVKMEEEPEKAASAQAMEVKKCSYCGAEVPIDSVYCKRCGTKLGSDWFSEGGVRIGKICVICGTENPSDHDYCKKCGTKL